LKTGKSSILFYPFPRGAEKASFGGMKKGTKRRGEKKRGSRGKKENRGDCSEEKKGKCEP